MRRVLRALLLAPLLVGCGEGPPPGTPAWYAMRLQQLGIPQMSVDMDLDAMTAGQPDRDQFVQLEEFGFSTVICLRPDTEDGTGWEEEAAAGRKFRFVRLPIRGAEDLTRANAERLAELLEERGMEVIYAATTDRVGALLAMKAGLVDGKPIEASIAFGKEHGLGGLESATRVALGTAGR